MIDLVHESHGDRYDLMIASCRPKVGWDNHHLVIGYKEEFYEVIGQEDAKPPRKYVYLLKKAPPWKLTAQARKYDPQEALIQ